MNFYCLETLYVLVVTQVALGLSNISEVQRGLFR